MAFSLLLAIFCFAALAWSSAVADRAVPAMFVFGDSLADVGNNNYLNTSTAKANFPPNGIDFHGRTPTGRFSDGYNNIDWLAQLVGYSESPPPFLSLTNGAQMLNGVNFASGGSGILDTTGQGSSLSFANQITDFKSAIDVLGKQIGEEKAAQIIAKSLFVISSGSNDMFGYYLTLGTQNDDQNKQFVASLVNKFSDRLKALYSYGARKFAVIGISHIGCVPAMRSRNIPTGRCIEDLNNLGRDFNAAAEARMSQLKLSLQGMQYSYGNVYDLMTLAMEKPQMFGYKDTQSACCGSGRFNGAAPCTLNATLCSNRNQYLFWDQFHPTQATSKFTARALYSGSQSFATPINVKLLAKY